MNKIILYDKNMNILKEKSDKNRVYMGYKKEIPKGSRIIFETDKEYMWIKVDKCIEKSLVYLPNKKMEYTIPYENNLKTCYAPEAFTGERFYFSLEEADEIDIKRKRNIALNTCDTKNFNGSYPHASANVETRNEAVFFACNAIDGIYASDGHGRFPYSSWGINQQENAEIKIDFGKEILIEEINLFLRADFPHDSYWTNMKLTFSDGENFNIDTVKKEGAQNFKIGNKKSSYILLSYLKKNIDDSPFPALTQIEVLGYFIF